MIGRCVCESQVDLLTALIMASCVVTLLQTREDPGRYCCCPFIFSARGATPARLHILHGWTMHASLIHYSIACKCILIFPH